MVFALVAQRALEPGSQAGRDPLGRRAGRHRGPVPGCPTIRPTGRWTSCSTRWTRSPREIFASVAHLLNLDLDIVFVDTTSTYWEIETADELAELADPAADDELTSPVEAGPRAFGHSKDHRDDLPQVVIAMAVTRDGVPVRCWTFPGDTADTAIIRTDQGRPGRLGPAPAGVGGRPRVRLRGQPGLPDPRWRALHPRREAAPHQHRGRRRARPPRPLPHRRRTTCGSRKSHVAPGGDGDGDDGARTQRFVVCHNPDRPSATSRSAPTSSPT